MRKSTPGNGLLPALLLAFMAGSGSVLGVENGAPPAGIPVTASMEEKSFRRAISRLETIGGAYSAELSEQLLSLGLALQAQGRHREAVDLLKRGVHLARINDGLYSSEQIPLLQGEIASHLALGQYAVADERQRYLYRVQVRSMESGKSRALAFMQQANWQYNAYRLQLGDLGYSRLMNMWDFYRLALNDILAREGDKSPELLNPLTGMLRAQYLISSYDPQDGETSYGSADDLGARQELNRFYAYQSQSYKKGSAVILAMHEIERHRHPQQSPDVADTMIMLGDWQLWHEEQEQALLSYQQAMMELGERDDAQVLIDSIFDTPVALPNMDGVRPLPAAVEEDQGNILLEFGINDRGRVIGLDRIDESDTDKHKANRLMRKLRKTKFRPRFEAGQPVGTDKIVRAYIVQ